MTLTVGLVTEGPNDRIVLKAVADAVSRSVAPHRQINYRPIQPTPDATGGGGQGGWTEVRKWCLRNDETERQLLVFSPSLTGNPACDVLIVQLDGDVLDRYGAHGPPAPPRPWTASVRSTYAEGLLSFWLWQSATPIAVPASYLLVVPVWAPETWLAAALDAGWPDPEEDDPVPKLIANRPDLEDPKRRGRLRKIRMLYPYKALSKELVANLATVRGRCRQLEKFCNSIETIVRT